MPVNKICSGWGPGWQRTSAVPYSNFSAASDSVNSSPCPLPLLSSPSTPLPRPQVSWQLWGNVLLPFGGSPNLDNGEEDWHSWLLHRESCYSPWENNSWAWTEVLRISCPVASPRGLRDLGLLGSLRRPRSVTSEPFEDGAQASFFLKYLRFFLTCYHGQETLAQEILVSEGNGYIIPVRDEEQNFQTLLHIRITWVLRGRWGGTP